MCQRVCGMGGRGGGLVTLCDTERSTNACIWLYLTQDISLLIFFDDDYMQYTRNKSVQAFFSLASVGLLDKLIKLSTKLASIVWVFIVA